MLFHKNYICNQKLKKKNPLKKSLKSWVQNQCVAKPDLNWYETIYSLFFHLVGPLISLENYQCVWLQCALLGVLCNIQYTYCITFIKRQKSWLLEYIGIRDYGHILTTPPAASICCMVCICQRLGEELVSFNFHKQPSEIGTIMIIV